MNCLSIHASHSKGIIELSSLGCTVYPFGRAMTFFLTALFLAEPSIVAAESSWKNDNLGVSFDYPTDAWVPLQISDKESPGGPLYVIGSFIEPGANQGEIWRDCGAGGRRFDSGKLKIPSNAGDIIKLGGDARGLESIKQEKMAVLRKAGYAVDHFEVIPDMKSYPSLQFRGSGKLTLAQGAIPVELMGKLLWTKNAITWLDCEIFPGRMPASKVIEGARAESAKILDSFLPLAAATLPEKLPTVSSYETIRVLGKIFGFIVLVYLIYVFLKRILRRKKT